MTGYGFGQGAGTLLSVRLFLFMFSVSDPLILRMVIQAGVSLLLQRVLSFSLEFWTFC